MFQRLANTSSSYAAAGLVLTCRQSQLSWRDITSLPDDVSLRTSANFGSILSTLWPFLKLANSMVAAWSKVGKVASTVVTYVNAEYSPV